MKQYLVVTVMAADRPGIVEQLAATISRHGGNWLESSMSQLAGQFAGILSVDISAADEAALREALSALASQGIRIQIEASGSAAGTTGEHTHISLVANDRPGIVGEITQALASAQVNVVSLETYCDSAPMSAELLFHALIEVAMPAGMQEEQLLDVLEALSSDLMVEVGELDDLFE